MHNTNRKGLCLRVVDPVDILATTLLPPAISIGTVPFSATLPFVITGSAYVSHGCVEHWAVIWQIVTDTVAPRARGVVHVTAVGNELQARPVQSAPPTVTDSVLILLPKLIPCTRRIAVAANRF